jgi:transposase
LGPVQAVIDQVLIDDETAPPKQRHTAAQLFRRLRDEHGYRGGYAQVQRYFRKHRRKNQETFIPLAHLPGQRLEADFGHIHVDLPEGRRLVPFLVTAWAYSNAPFVLALPFEHTWSDPIVPHALTTPITGLRRTTLTSPSYAARGSVCNGLLAGQS